MIGHLRLVRQPGSPYPGLGLLLRDAGLAVDDGDPGTAMPANTLVTLLPGADAAMDEARAFAASLAGQRGGQIILIHGAAANGDWESGSRAALLGAFARHAALIWSKLDIRVNGLAVGSGVTDRDIAGAILALRSWRSMTGQTIRLDV